MRSLRCWLAGLIVLCDRWNIRSPSVPVSYLFIWMYRTEWMWGGRMQYCVGGGHLNIMCTHTPSEWAWVRESGMRARKNTHPLSWLNVYSPANVACQGPAIQLLRDTEQYLCGGNFLIDRRPSSSSIYLSKLFSFALSHFAPLLMFRGCCGLANPISSHDPIQPSGWWQNSNWMALSFFITVLLVLDHTTGSNGSLQWPSENSRTSDCCCVCNIIIICVDKFSKSFNRASGRIEPSQYH